MAKKTVLSGSTTSGDLTLGNYIGAINNWKLMQDEYDCFYMVADLHALTTKQDPKELEHRCLSFFAQYLACGLDPEKNVIFMQSHISEHAELAWILNCLTPMGSLNRMTQFKEKSQLTREINNGLYSYPVLMAADILLYQADLVPVGEDQKQHLELTRDLAMSFNNKFGEVFKIPDPFIPKVGARIMSLQDPAKKMSKSDENTSNFISILDAPKNIEKKIKSAVTDSDPNPKIIYDVENKAGLANLMTIYQVLTNETMAEIEKKYVGKMYGHLKVDLAAIVCEKFKPIQEKYTALMTDRGELMSIMAKNADRARHRTQVTIDKVYKNMGLILRKR